MPTIANVLGAVGNTGSLLGGGGGVTWSGVTNTVNTGAAGTAGVYTAGTTAGTPSYYIASSYPHINNISQHDITIQYKNEYIEVGKTLKMLMDRLCVIEPNFKLMEKYPALKEAYDNYKLLEALLANEDNTKDE
jgi:hypothetical protein